MKRSFTASVWLAYTSLAPWRETKRDRKSDVDLFFDTENPRFSLIELVDVYERVNAILGVASDVMTRASLHPMLRQWIETEALRVF